MRAMKEVILFVGLYREFSKKELVRLSITQVLRKLIRKKIKKKMNIPIGQYKNKKKETI